MRKLNDLGTYVSPRVGDLRIMAGRWQGSTQASYDKLDIRSPNGSETVTFQYIELWTANKMITVASFRTAGARASRGCRGPPGVKIIRPIELFRVS